MKLMIGLWSDEAGFVISSELILIAALIVVGLLVGLATVRDQVVQELADSADAISELQQDYQWSGTAGHTSSAAGSLFNDQNDFCEEPDLLGVGQEDQLDGDPPRCISLIEAGNSE